MSKTETDQIAAVPNPAARVFHLAIPTHDLDAAEAFYTQVLGAVRARRYDDRVTFNFMGHQVVCHLAPDEIDREIKMYPRHFGMTFLDLDDFNAVHQQCTRSGHPFFENRFTRWPEKPERHETFFVADPSNNLIEFKYYEDPRFVY
jgi:extradiol dioxygenase family protein